MGLSPAGSNSSAGASTEPPGRVGPRTQRGRRLLVIFVLVVLVGSLLSAFVYVLITGELCACSLQVTAAITMTPTEGGTCTATTPAEFAANTYNVSIGGATSTITTTDFGLSLSEPGASGGIPPGASVPSSGSRCAGGPTAYVPSSGAWDVVLLAPGGTSVLAEFMQCKTNPNPSANQTAWFTPSCGALPAPVTLSSGQTLAIVANGVALSEATLGVYGVNGASVTGSVTL